jgi:hypothetical protein
MYPHTLDIQQPLSPFNPYSITYLSLHHRLFREKSKCVHFQPVKYYLPIATTIGQKFGYGRGVLSILIVLLTYCYAICATSYMDWQICRWCNHAGGQDMYMLRKTVRRNQGSGGVDVPCASSAPCLSNTQAHPILLSRLNRHGISVSCAPGLVLSLLSFLPTPFSA